MSGKLTENIDLMMVATDDNLPIQPDGTTQQLQEFDRVFIQLSDKHTKLIAGDFFCIAAEQLFYEFQQARAGIECDLKHSDGKRKKSRADGRRKCCDLEREILA